MSWYLLHRGWQDNPVFRNEEFSRRDAFIWLIENAHYKSGNVYAPKGEIALERGQLCHSLRFMAKAWKWEESRVRRFLSSLVNAKIIEAATDAGQTVVTICNYAKYQTLETDSDAPTAAASPQHRRSIAAKKKEGKEGNKEDIDTNVSIGELALENENEEVADSLKPEHFVEAWNDLAIRISRPQIRNLTPERRQKLKARINGHTIEDFQQVLSGIEKSPFLRGEKNWSGATFDWVLGKGNFQKILEGNYNS